MRHFSNLLLVLFCLIFALELEAKTDKYRIMWRDDPSTTMVIGWNQISGDQPIVYYDIQDHQKNVLAYQYSIHPTVHNRSKGLNNNFVRLSNLQPSTTYYFVIKDSEGCSERMSFETAPDNPYERLSIIAGGDSRNYRKARQKANRLVAKLQPHCVMFGGDMTGGDNATQWKAWFDDWQETISPEGKLTPLIITRGNHEYSNKTLTDLFDVAPPQAYYALSLGGNLLRVYTLNSLIPSGGNQKKWLEKDLQSSQDYYWRIAQYHFAMRPHTSKKSERNNQVRDWATLFDRYNVQMAVESDAHCVKWTYPVRPSRERGSDEGFIRDDYNGTVYVGEGCWGAPLRQNNDDKKWTRNSGSFNQFKWIFIDHERIEIRTVKTDKADEASTVDLKNRFEVPDGLDLWNPSNGSVVVIENEPERPYAYAHFTSLNNKSSKAAPPMMLVDFEIEQEEEGIIVKWKTQAEKDNSKVFEIQKSIDGNNFQSIANINSKGKGDHTYSYFEFLTSQQAAHVSYRLKELLPDGQFKFYRRQELNLSADGIRYNKKLNKLIPESRNGMIKAKYVLDESADIAIRLVNTERQVIAKSDYKSQRSGNYLQSIDMNRFPDGQYMLTIKANEEVIQKYLVVK